MGGNEDTERKKDATKMDLNYSPGEWAVIASKAWIKQRATSLKIQSENMVAVNDQEGL